MIRFCEVDQANYFLVHFWSNCQNKGFSSELLVGYPDLYKPEDGQRAQQLKCSDNNNNDMDNKYNANLKQKCQSFSHFLVDLQYKQQKPLVLRMYDSGVKSPNYFENDIKTLY